MDIKNASTEDLIARHDELDVKTDEQLKVSDEDRMELETIEAELRLRGEWKGIN